MRSYLVVGNQTLTSPELATAMGELMAGGPTDFHVVVPATPNQKGFTWDENEARAVARERLSEFDAGLKAMGALVSGEVGELADEPPRVVWGGRALLKLIETAPLLLGGFGQEAGNEDLPVGRIRTPPAQADDLDAGLGQGKLVSALCPLSAALCVCAKQHQASDAFRMAHCVRDRDGAALGNAEQREQV